MSEMELLRKRLFFQSQYRGCKENDWILGRFAVSWLGQLDAAELQIYSQFLNEAEPDAYRWLVLGQDCPEKYAPLIAKIRAASILPHDDAA